MWPGKHSAWVCLVKAAPGRARTASQPQAAPLLGPGLTHPPLCWLQWGRMHLLGPGCGRGVLGSGTSDNHEMTKLPLYSINHMLADT